MQKRSRTYIVIYRADGDRQDRSRVVTVGLESYDVAYVAQKLHDAVVAERKPLADGIEVRAFIKYDVIGSGPIVNYVKAVTSPSYRATERPE